MNTDTDEMTAIMIVSSLLPIGKINASLIKTDP